MGRKSSKDVMTLYKQLRDERNLTREEVCNGKLDDHGHYLFEPMSGMAPEHLEKIENGKLIPTPSDIIVMERFYKTPELFNYYCSHECEFCEKVPEVKKKELAQIAVEAINSLNRLNREKDRLLEIVEDGEITDDELDDFIRIKGLLDRIQASVDNLQLWVDKKIASGGLDSKKVK